MNQKPILLKGHGHEIIISEAGNRTTELKTPGALVKGRTGHRRNPKNSRAVSYRTQGADGTRADPAQRFWMDRRLMME
jgi:hypothetical protein